MAGDTTFQSRSGFSGRLDIRVNLSDFKRFMFQSRSGFSGRLDIDGLGRHDLGVHVSIPFWVFWSSRPTRWFRPFAPDCFNPVLGFLVVSTSLRFELLQAVERFQSRSGFSGRLDALSVSCFCVQRVFQSRSGFSGRLDTTTGEVVEDETGLFQSRSGFSGRLDGQTYPVNRPANCFNPVLGFLVVSTA